MIVQQFLRVRELVQSYHINNLVLVVYMAVQKSVPNYLVVVQRCEYQTTGTIESHCAGCLNGGPSEAQGLTGNYIKLHGMDDNI